MPIGSDPVVHGLFGAQFGDLEFDVGTSVRWNMFLVDDFHISDVNLGSQRYWVVNWDKTFPECEHDVLGINFFSNPVAFRQRQWEMAKPKLNIGPDDWVLWCDSHEGISFDNTSLPDEYAAAPFRSWLWREIERAEDASSDRVVLPYFVWCRDSEVQNVLYDMADPDGNTLPSDQLWQVQQALAVPHYEANQGLMRLCKASVLDDPGFDWNDLDALATPDADVKAQIVSYGYGHWNVLNIDTVGGDVEPLTEENDDGFRMRKKISQVRPLASFPTGAWDADDSPDGLPGPWGPDAHFDAPAVTEEFAHSTPHASMEGIRTPLYNTVVRINLRDGIWYEAGLNGNIPLSWDTDNQKWITHYAPDQWPEQGVASWDVAVVPDPPTEIEAVYREVTREDENYEEYTEYQALVGWAEPLSTGSENLLQYRVEVEHDGVVTTAGIVLPTKKQFRHFPLEFGTYRYRVYAVSDVGDSEVSDWSDVMIWLSATYYQDDEPVDPSEGHTWQTVTDGFTATFDGTDWAGYGIP